MISWYNSSTKINWTGFWNAFFPIKNNEFSKKWVGSWPLSVRYCYFWPTSSFLLTPLQTIPWLVGHGKSIAHSAWSFAFVTKNPTKVQKCNFFAFGRPWKFPWPTPWKFPGPGNFHGLNLLLPMEISRAWKFPWHGKFQALTPTYPCRFFWWRIFCNEFISAAPSVVVCLNFSWGKNQGEGWSKTKLFSIFSSETFPFIF